MSQENVEIVRQIFAAWDADDFDGLLALFDDELVTRRHPPMPDAGTWHGRAGALDVVADWLQSFDDFTVTAEEFIDAPHHVVVRTVQGGRGSGGGVPITGPVWFVCGVRGGRLVAWDIYAIHEQALEAAGVRE